MRRAEKPVEHTGLASMPFRRTTAAQDTADRKGISATNRDPAKERNGGFEKLDGKSASKCGALAAFPPAGGCPGAIEGKVVLCWEQNEFAQSKLQMTL
jgi:hypothetical protein